MFFQFSLKSRWLMLLTLFNFIVNRCSSLYCVAECNCRYYPRRPVICSFKPGMSSFPSNLPSETSFLFVSGNVSLKNDIQNLRKRDLANLRNLERLSLTFSNLLGIDEGTFSGMSSLLGLYLQHNRLQHLSSKTFEGLNALYHLDLTGNLGCRVDDDAFANLRSLQELYLGNMTLESIPDMANLAHLKRLDLHGNKLISVDSGMLKHFPRLVLLDISGNNIATFSSLLRDDIVKVAFVGFYGNPLHCNCEAMWLKSLPTKYLYATDMGRPLICASPKHLRYKALVGMPRAEFVCKPPNITNCENTTYQVSYHSNLSVSCVMEADPIPSVIWVKPNGLNVSGGVSNFSHPNVSSMYKVLLSIRNTSHKDEGIWKLIVSTPFGHDEFHFNIAILVDKDGISKTTVSHFTGEGEDSHILVPALSVLLTGCILGTGIISGVTLYKWYINKKHKNLKINAKL